MHGRRFAFLYQNVRQTGNGKGQTKTCISEKITEPLQHGACDHRDACHTRCGIGARTAAPEGAHRLPGEEGGAGAADCGRGAADQGY